MAAAGHKGRKRHQDLVWRRKIKEQWYGQEGTIRKSDGAEGDKKRELSF